MVASEDVPLDVEQSVDEIFAQLSISQIQNLSRQYKQNGDAAKADLHNLVGSKYRDLIEIAESILDMYNVGTKVDSNLAQLSYRSSKFVNFNQRSNPVARFNTNVRAIQASKAQQNSRSSILKNVINNSLVRFDLTMDKCSHTSQFVAHAKIYYTIDQVFQDVLQSTSHLNSTYNDLKSRFIRYLELELSTYSVLSLQANDVKQENHSLTIQDLLKKDTKEFDSYMEGEIEDDLDNSTYYTNLTAIVNYLLAYLICKGDLLLTVAEDFTMMRFTYLQDLLLNQFKFIDTVNFLPILKYFECTCQYLNLFQDDSSELYQKISSISQWDPSEIIGFNHWLKETQVKFDNSKYSSNLAGSTSSMIDNGMQKFPVLITEFVNKLMTKETLLFDDILHPVKLFSKFVLTLRNLQDLLENENLDFLSLKFINRKDSLNSLLERTMLIVNTKYSNYFDSLYLSSEALLKHDDSSDEVQLFTPELADLMYKNMDAYTETLLKSTKSSGASKSISDWFHRFEEFINFILSRDSDSILSKLTKQSIDWEGFTVDTVQLELSKLNKETTRVFWNKVSKFTDLIRVQLDENLPLNQVYHVLDILVAITSEISRLEISKDLQITIDSCVNSCYSKIISSVEFKLPENYFEVLKSNELDESQIIPSMVLTRLILKLCRNLLSANEEVSNQQYCKLFLNKNTRSTFVSLKNEMLGKVVTKAVSDFVSMLPHKEETEAKNLKSSNDNEHNEQTSENHSNAELIPPEAESQSTKKTEVHQLARGFLVDMAYILSFTEPEIKTDNEIIQKVISSINKDQTIIDDLAVTILFKTVHDFYNSTKGVYLPLLYY